MKQAKNLTMWQIGFENAYMRGSKMNGLGRDYDEGYESGQRQRDEDDRRNDDGNRNENH